MQSKLFFYDTQVRSSFMTFCKADCYGSAEVKMLITKYILVKVSDVELHKICPDSLDADPSHRYNIHIRLFLPCRETMPENWIFFNANVQWSKGDKRQITRCKSDQEEFLWT